ncbi:MAG: hypothetical protein IPJ58_13265 [Ardenticatenia bacterium]|nr:hypothetical protein [Ardenticatenia bacterium]
MAGDRSRRPASVARGEVTVLSSVGLPSLDLRNLAWARGRLWAATAGAAERLPDGRWRPHGRDDGLADEALRGVVAGPRKLSGS